MTLSCISKFAPMSISTQHLQRVSDSSCHSCCVRKGPGYRVSRVAWDVRSSWIQGIWSRLAHSFARHFHIAAVSVHWLSDFPGKPASHAPADNDTESRDTSVVTAVYHPSSTRTRICTRKKAVGLQDWTIMKNRGWVSSPLHLGMYLRISQYFPWVLNFNCLIACLWRLWSPRSVPISVSSHSSHPFDHLSWRRNSRSTKLWHLLKRLLIDIIFRRPLSDWFWFPSWYVSLHLHYCILETDNPSIGIIGKRCRTCHFHLDGPQGQDGDHHHDLCGQLDREFILETCRSWQTLIISNLICSSKFRPLSSPSLLSLDGCKFNLGPWTEKNGFTDRADAFISTHNDLTLFFADFEVRLCSIA